MSRARTNDQTKEFKRTFSQVKSTWDEAEANALLATGWTLLHAGIAHADDMGYRAKPVFVLAKPQK